MITEPQACLRYISSIHRRTVRDILAPREPAEFWIPPVGEGEKS